MDAMEAILTRRSIRKYQLKPIPIEIVHELLAAGMSAPSAVNIRPWQFVVIADRDIMDEIPKFHPYASMVKGASLVIVVCGDVALSNQYWVQDCAAAAENILIATRAQGLGAVWLGVYPVEVRVMSLKKLLKLPENIMPLCLIPMGYPAEERPRSPGMDKTKIHYNKW